MGIYPRYVHDLIEICEISECQEQSVKVNAFLICRDPHGVSACPDVAVLDRTLRVGCKIKKSLGADKEK